MAMEVEGISRNSKSFNLSIEHDQDKGTQYEDCGLTSAHTIDHDSWQQVGLLLVTSYNCGWILTFSNLILVPLGWKWGIIWLIVVGLYVAYSNWQGT
ncbi:hypothetical protein Lalb_Chr07g0183121 [Lupinus albus]|uniref:Uncharacterized protein n=1 Tax=Lupinus albus TaxID=3870 RepID=A0A6A4Q8D0_LUPAL|nr:hypothetical protein Lalb_Chr07g0183121 [Lupinus albus]